MFIALAYYHIVQCSSVEALMQHKSLNKNVSISPSKRNIRHLVCKTKFTIKWFIDAVFFSSSDRDP